MDEPEALAVGIPVRVLRLVACLGLVLASSMALADGSAAEPRTLVLALDGVPLRSVEAAVEQGAFADWSRPRGMISTFPSMTSVAFTAILRPFCVHPIAGYETLYFDRQDNVTVGGTSVEYLERYFPWRTVFQVRKRSFGSKVAGYTRPMYQARKMIGRVEKMVLASTVDPVMVHVASTDVVTHIRGDAPIIEYLLELSHRVEELEVAHQEKWARPLRVVMLSDHGNTDGGVSSAGDLRETLGEAGFTIRKRLESPEDLVIPAYGAVSYSALYLDAERAAEVGRAAVENPAVDLAAWIGQPGEMRVISRGEEAVVRWRELSDSAGFSYDSVTGDPLRLDRARTDLVAAGLVGSNGFAEAEQWRRVTLDHRYPDPLRRLVEALQGTWVENPATVILSLHDDRAWGSKKAWVGSFLMGAGLKGTHGALDAESTMGFLIANEPLPDAPSAVPASQTLSPWFDPGDCIAMTRVD